MQPQVVCYHGITGGLWELTHSQAHRTVGLGKQDGWGHSAAVFMLAVATEVVWQK